MAIQKCLYCGDNISELAVKCPKCQQTSPCDELIKNQRDFGPQTGLKLYLNYKELKLLQIIDKKFIRQWGY